MNQQQKKSFEIMGFGEEWTKNMMGRKKEDIVFMFKIIGSTNLRMAREIGELEKSNFHLQEQIEKLDKG